jgi:hypothetical protein
MLVVLLFIATALPALGVSAALGSISFSLKVRAGPKVCRAVPRFCWSSAGRPRLAPAGFVVLERRVRRRGKLAGGLPFRGCPTARCAGACPVREVERGLREQVFAEDGARSDVRIVPAVCRPITPVRPCAVGCVAGGF